MLLPAAAAGAADPAAPKTNGRAAGKGGNACHVDDGGEKTVSVILMRGCEILHIFYERQCKSLPRLLLLFSL